MGRHRRLPPPLVARMPLPFRRAAVSLLLAVTFTFTPRM